eukprot:319508_1
MEKLIKFMSLSSELDNNEFIQFLSQSVKSQGTNIFRQTLFNNFKNSPSSIVPFTNIVTSIIQARESKPQSETTTTSLDALPYELIGECASFLQDYEFFRFVKTSRKIYLSCYSPSKLYKLSYQLYDSMLANFYCKNQPKYTKIYNRYKFAKKSFIYIQIFNQLCKQDQLLWKQNISNMDTLMIINLNDGSNSNNDILQFSNHNTDSMNFLNVNKLKLEGNWSNCNSIFCNQQLPMTKYLWLESNELPFAIDHNILQKAFPNLKAIKITQMNTNHVATILNELYDKLEILAIDNIINVTINFTNFVQLKEIHFTSVNADGFMNLSRDLKLECVRIHHIPSKIDIKDIMCNMLKEQLSLERIHMRFDGSYLKYALEQLELVLLACKEQERKCDTFYIEFEVLDWKEINMMNTLYFAVVNVVQALEKMKINHFRLGILIKKNIGTFGNDINDWDSWLRSLNDIKQSYLVQYQIERNYKSQMFKLTVSNKNCIIQAHVQSDCFNLNI